MATFQVVRSTEVAADRARVHGLLNDFHEWTAWSPWEEIDPNLQRTYTGPDAGVGAHYAWQGNSKAGAGTMEISESADDRVVVDLRFTKPFKAAYDSRFDLAESGAGTRVTWTMSGNRGLIMDLMGRVYFDKAVGKDFERGLARLKAAAES